MTDLPEDRDLMTKRVWVLTDRDAAEHRVSGVFLGRGSSRTTRHTHDPRRPVEAGTRCGSCRWTELRLFADDAEYPCFVLVSSGRSAVPGEEDRTTVYRFATAMEVLEQVTDRREPAAPRIPVPARRMLAQAATYDQDVFEAWTTRRVA